MTETEQKTTKGYDDMTAEELAAERARLVAQGQYLVQRLGELGKSHVDRPTFVGEKTAVDARLKRVNAAIKRHNVATAAAGHTPSAAVAGIEPIHLYAAAALQALIPTDLSKSPKYMARMAWEYAEAMEAEE